MKRYKSEKGKNNEVVFALRDVPVIYFLFNKNKLVYIGRTINLRKRLTFQRQAMPFDSFAFIKSSIDRIDDYERRLIRYFKPFYNNALFTPKKNKINAKSNAGRKPIYNIASLDVGERIKLKPNVIRKYMHQYAQAYNDNHYPKQFKAEWIDERAHIIRIA